MRIACPFCGPRGNEEFTYLGDATLVRRPPIRPRPTRDAGVLRLRLSARQSGRPASRALVSRRRLPRLAGRRRATRARTRSATSTFARGAARRRWRHDASRQADRPSPSRRADRPRAAAVGFTFDGAGVSRLSPATRSPRRCSPTACGWSAARSSITARAASSPPAPRSRTRWSSCAAARGASRTRARRRPSSTTGSSPRARTAGRRSRSTCCRVNSLVAPLLRRRLLLQDLHVAGDVLGDGVRAADPPRRRPRPRGRRERSRPLREGLRALRRAGDRRRAGRADGGAGGRARRRARRSCATRISGSAGGCSPNAARSTAARRRVGRRTSRPSWRRCPTCASCAARRCSACYDDGTYGALERVNDHLAAPPAHQPRQRLWRIVAKRCGAGGRRHRAADRVRRQRPPRRDAGGRGAHLSQPLCGGAGPQRRGVHHQRRDGWRTVGDLSRAGVRVAAVVDARTEVPASIEAAAKASGCAAARRRRRRAARSASHARARGRCRGRQRARPSASTAISSPCPAAGTRRCI